MVLSVDSDVSMENTVSVFRVECDGWCRHVARKSPVISPAICRALPLLLVCVRPYPGTLL